MNQPTLIAPAHIRGGPRGLRGQRGHLANRYRAERAVFVVQAARDGYSVPAIAAALDLAAATIGRILTGTGVLAETTQSGRRFGVSLAPLPFDIEVPDRAETKPAGQSYMVGQRVAAADVAVDFLASEILEMRGTA